MTKRSKITAALKEPEKHPFIFLFFLTIATAVLGNGISGLILDTLCAWLDQYTPLTKLGWQMIMVVILILVLTVSISNLPAIMQRLLSKQTPYVSKVKQMEADVSCRGLIVFMSPSKLEKASSAETAILHHWDKESRTISYCWIICGGQKSYDSASEMVNGRLIEQKGSIKFIYGAHPYTNPEDELQSLSLLLPPDRIDDPNYIRQLIEAIYIQATGEFQLLENEILIDYTGGLKSMTAGAILAGADPDRRLQYIRNEYQEDGDRIPGHEEMMEVDISYRVKPIDSRSQ
jgi:CRISPR-associated protein (Cas_Cas02710)